MSQRAVPGPGAPPAAPPRFFYGWWIVFGAFIAQFVAIGMQAPVSGAFLVPMSADLGWTRAEFAVATSVGTAVSALIGFFIGVYVDRYGPRPLMLVGNTIVGGTLIAISRVNNLWEFVVLRGIVFTVGFVLIGNLVVNVALSKWFVRRRGWVISIASLGVSLGSVVVTPVMVRVVDQFGWRDGWIVLGIGAWVLVYPIALLMRRQPEDFGLLPDGAVEGDQSQTAALEAARADFENSFTRGEAIRTAAMWLLVLSFGLAQVGLIALLFHDIPFLTDAGFSRTQASLLFSGQGMAALLSKFAWGWLMQRFPARALSAISFVMSGVGVAILVPAARAHSLEVTAIASLIWGWGIGGTIPLQEYIWAAFFGRRHLGAVRSAAMPAALVFGAGGPVLTGLYFDIVGSYNGALLTFAVLWFVAAGLIMIARPPLRPSRGLPAAPGADEHGPLLAAGPAG